MNYYDEKDDRPKLYGGVAAVAYVVIVAALLFLTYIPITITEIPEMMIIEIVVHGTRGNGWDRSGSPCQRRTAAQKR